MTKFLAIDDNQDNLIVLNALLKESFPMSNILTSHSALEGIKISLIERPDIILLDIVMPEMDGYETCKIIKANENTKNIPIIMITAARTDRESRIKALESGADAFLTKPIDESELKAQIRAMLRIKEAEDLKSTEKDRLEALIHERTQALESELTERKNTEKQLQLSLTKLEHSRIAELNLMEDLLAEMEERKKSEQIQNVLYTISNAVLTAKSLEELIEIIRHELSSLIDTTNFYIAFYDAETDLFTSPYERDEMDNIESWPANKSTTGLVIKNKKPILVNEEQIRKLCDEGEIDLIGHPAKVWLGVPLHIEDEIIGALVVQSYEDSKAFNQKHVDILEFVSHQISISIQKRKFIDDLKIALDKAEESDRLKTSFLANMSHEIRTPMNGILGFSDLLEDTDITPQERKLYIDIIQNNGRHLLSIINDIIDIAKIDSGVLQTSPIDFNLNDMLDELFVTFKNEKRKAHKGNLAIILEKSLEEEDSYVYCDDTRLKQILLNLLSNAIKFTNTGHIKFGYKLIDEKLLFYVEDTGKGIAKDKQKVIFERFRQEEENYTRQFGGTGLGLSISSGLIEILGGEEWLVSEEGFGSTFYFTLPYQKSDINAIEEVHVLNSPKKNISDRTILIAEDVQDNIDLIRIYLKDSNLDLVFANNGIEAISLYNSNPKIELVLMDIQMPEMNGFEATERLKSHNPKLPIIAMTAFAMEEEKIQCIEKGCDDYISKPFNKKDLISVISKHL